MTKRQLLKDTIEEVSEANGDDKIKKETLNEKRLNIRRSIEDFLDEKRHKNLYGHLDELEE